MTNKAFLLLFQPLIQHLCRWSKIWDVTSAFHFSKLSKTPLFQIQFMIIILISDNWSEVKYSSDWETDYRKYTNIYSHSSGMPQGPLKNITIILSTTWTQYEPPWSCCTAYNKKTGWNDLNCDAITTNICCVFYFNFKILASKNRKWDCKLPGLIYCVKRNSKIINTNWLICYNSKYRHKNSR